MEHGACSVQCGFHNDTWSIPNIWWTWKGTRDVVSRSRGGRGEQSIAPLEWWHATQLPPQSNGMHLAMQLRPQGNCLH